MGISYSHAATGQNYPSIDAAAVVFEGVTEETLADFGLVKTTISDPVVNSNEDMAEFRTLTAGL